MGKQLLFVLTIFFSGITYGQVNNAFIKGADVSFIPQIEDLGGAYYSNGMLTDPLVIFKQNEVNFIRLRLWHSPTDGYCGLQSTLEMAERIKQLGLKFLLNFHYSDTWADPGDQEKPAAWQSLSYEELVDSVYAYTFYVIQAFDAANALPDMVQIGNEIIGGFLWPEGRVGGSFDTPQQWTRFTDLLKAAHNAITDAAPDTTIPVMIHIDRGADNSGSRWFFENLTSYQVPFDIIGQSFYPWWHGTLSQVTINLNDLASRYNKDIIIAEVAYPWTLGSADNVNNFVWNTDQLHTGYPATVNGQFNFLYDLMEIVSNVPDNRGLGIFYWAPEYISVPPIGSPWENLTLFDFNGEALSSFSAFHEIDTSGISVTFRLNTSTNWDTLHPYGFAQIRGEVVNGSNIFPDGEQLSWDDNSDLVMDNIYGDYWELTLRAAPGSEIHYKYWTGHTINDPTFLRLGWEGPIQPYDSSAGNFRKFIAGDSDTVLQVEYYNSSSETVNQYWRPFEHKEDSVAVYCRVNMGGVTSIGEFDPELNGPVGIRGGPVNGEDILSWDKSRTLTREMLSVFDGSFWSGVVYYPLSTSGAIQFYKFYVENSGDPWETVFERGFQVPFEDRTISWVFFNDQRVVVDAADDAFSISDFQLYQNFPNPFNSSTKIAYDLNEQMHVKLIIYNTLGQEVNMPVNEFKNAGRYSFEWDGRDSDNNVLPSGVYFIRLLTDNHSASIKTMLLK